MCLVYSENLSSMLLWTLGLYLKYEILLCVVWTWRSQWAHIDVTRPQLFAGICYMRRGMLSMSFWCLSLALRSMDFTELSYMKGLSKEFIVTPPLNVSTWIVRVKWKNKHQKDKDFVSFKTVEKNVIVFADINKPLFPPTPKHFRSPLPHAYTPKINNSYLLPPTTIKISCLIIITENLLKHEYSIKLIIIFH